MSINKRLNELIHKLGITPYEFSKRMGNKRHDTIYNLLKNEETSPSPKTLNKIKETYPEINYSWLLTGEGEMLKREESSSLENEVTAIPQSNYKMVEYVDLRASAGKLGGGDIEQLPETHKRLVPSEYEKGDYLVVRVDGNSMDDGSKRSLADGDEILIKEIGDNDFTNLPIRKSLFVITSKEGNVLKQITKINQTEKHITCHSFNSNYEDFNINFEDIFQIFIVCKITQKQISLV